ncbi:MAG: DUF6507 family protein [Microbacterium sp.]
MSEWKISGAEVQTVLEDVEEKRETLATESITEGQLTDAFEGLSWGGALTSPVSEAVNTVLTQYSETNIPNIANRIGAGQLGVANATISYNNGQEEMAGNFQTEMVSAAETGDMSYFEKHGHRE